ncbi:MAG: ABC transporter substrate-binding protein [Deltaproteobacteria bacterium]|nr:ABC transporter substrate-binding protein [Deltaproteobacteria bacterium]
MKRPAILLVLFAFLAGCTREPDTVKIGVIASLTGNYSAYGKRAWEGIKLAVQEINQKGGLSGKRIETYIEDDMSTGQPALAPLNKFMDVDKIPVTLAMVPGPTLSLLAKPAEQGKMVLLSSLALSTVSPQSGEYAFQALSSGTLEAIMLGRLAVEQLKGRDFAILYSNDVYGKMSADVFKRYVLERRGAIEFYDFFQPGRQEFKGYLESMRQHEPDVIYMIGNGAEVGAFVSQARAASFTQPILTSNMAGPELVERAKKAADGVIFLAEDLSPAGKAEAPVAERDKKYRNLDTFAAEGYDLLHIVARAIQIGGVSSEGVKKGLESIRSFEGINGKMRIGKGSERPDQRPPMTIKDGKFIPFEPGGK